MDWVTVIRKEAQTRSILRTDELACKYSIVPAAVTQALARQEQKERVCQDFCVNGPVLFLGMGCRGRGQFPFPGPVM
jgi:hypothetical protein